VTGFVGKPGGGQITGGVGRTVANPRSGEELHELVTGRGLRVFGRSPSVKGFKRLKFDSFFLPFPVVP
jgi:hypothetical protein